MKDNDWYYTAYQIQSDDEEYLNPIEPYPIAMLKDIKGVLGHYEECNHVDEQENIEFINYLLRNCIIIDKNKLLKMIHREKLLEFYNDSNFTDAYRYSLVFERIIKIGKHKVPAGKEDLILKELDERVYQEFIKYFKEHLEVEDKV